MRIEQNTYRQRMIGIERLPETDNPKSIIQWMESYKYQYRELGKTKTETKQLIRKKLLDAYIVTGSENYYHAYSLLHRFNGRIR